MQNKIASPTACLCREEKQSHWRSARKDAYRRHAEAVNAEPGHEDAGRLFPMQEFVGVFGLYAVISEL